MDHINEPELVTPLARNLISETNERTHETYTVGGVARVCTALARGWTASRGSKPSVEDIAANFDEIRSEDGYIVPDSVADEPALLAEALT